MSAPLPLGPQPIRIFHPNEKIGDAEKENLKNLFAEFREQYGDCEVVVLSIAGRFRQGKSFILNFFIRYLRARSEGRTIWLDESCTDEITGFECPHQPEAATLGVLIWPEIFKIADAAGEDFAVILIDTQGVFDRNVSLDESKLLFSLSILLSSVQIFNVMHDIDMNNLDFLEVFTDFSCEISGRTNNGHHDGEKAHQELIFLIRDWQYPEKVSYGWEGGQNHLNKLFGTSGVTGELASKRANIESWYESIRCFLMPEPTKKVFTSRKISDAGSEFLNYVRALVEDIFVQENLRAKKSEGKVLKVSDFGESVNHYVRLLQSGEYPSLKRLLQCDLGARNFILANRCAIEYEKCMQQLLTDPIKSKTFDNFHDSVYEKILSTFNSSTRGDATSIDDAKEYLDSRIGTRKEEFRKFNSEAYKALIVKETGKGAAGGGLVGTAAGAFVGIGGAAVGGAAGAVIGGATAACIAAFGGVNAELKSPEAKRHTSVFSFLKKRAKTYSRKSAR